MVSGGAGADAQKTDPNAAAGSAIGELGAVDPDIYNIAGGPSSAGASSSGGQAGSNVGMGGGLSGSGFLSDSGSPSSSLAGVFGNAIGMGSGPKPQGAGSSIF